MKNILLFMPYGSVGGMERLALSFYRQYKKSGYNVTAVKIVGLKDDIINFGADEIVLSQKDFCEYTKLQRLKLYFKLPFILGRIIKKYNIEYSISFGDMANTFSALSRTNELKVASIHALKSVEFTNNSQLNKLFKLGYKSIYKKFQKVVCISNAIKEDLINNCEYKFNNLRVIYNPHDIQLIKDKSKETLSIVDDEIFSDSKIILFLGRLTGQKSPWHLIKAFSHLNDADTKLVFIGDGDKTVEEYCKYLVNEFGLMQKVIFLGRRENPYKYLSKANVLALTSQYEGTPNVIVEAITLGIPIVSSFCTNGIMEMMALAETKIQNQLIITESGIITPNLFQGILSIPENYEITDNETIIAQALKYILVNQQKFNESINANKSELLKKYDISEVCEKYLSEHN
jgi:glycosyltransferase involved in cell wall biosynthesis